jgi:bacteriocin-like protein
MLAKLKNKFTKVLTNAELQKVTGGLIQMYRCTEVWNGWDPVVRTCGDSYEGCNKCIYTGSGCTVTCTAIQPE